MVAISAVPRSKSASPVKTGAVNGHQNGLKCRSRRKLTLYIFPSKIFCCFNCYKFVGCFLTDIHNVNLPRLLVDFSSGRISAVNNGFLSSVGIRAGLTSFSSAP